MSDLILPDDFHQQASIRRLFEKQRVSATNLLYSLTSFPKHKDWGMHLDPTHPDVVLAQAGVEHFARAEASQEATIVSVFLKSPLYEWCETIPGLKAGKLVARLLGEIGDPYMRRHEDGTTEPRTNRQLKALCGLSVVNGKAPKHSGKEQSNWNARARVRLWLITDQLVKQGGTMAKKGTVTPYHATFTEGVERYSAEQYRGT